MPAIHFDDLSFSYSSAVEVFRSVTVHIGEGWTGVVGPNGAGKSTLLSLIEGELVPDAGNLVLDPSGAAVARCRQEVDEPTAEIRTFAETMDALSGRWMGLLGLDPEGLLRWDSLSPGERKRWQVGAALAADPNVLLLDEPTNHLDAEARHLVEEALARFRGVGLVVSHDRGFLNRLTTRTLRVGGGGLRLWSAAYSTALAEWTAEEEGLKARHDKARRKEKALKGRLADERRTAEERSAGFKRRLRGAAPKDHDARSLAAKERHASGQAAGQQRRTVLRSAAERAGQAARELVPEKVHGGNLFFDFQPSPKRRLLHFAGPLKVGDQVLADHVDATVLRDDRIRLVGPNGAGKSTLLAALLRDAGIPSHRFLLLPQELTRQQGIELLNGLDDLPTHRRGRVLNVVAALGVDPDELLASARPSPGEVRKLAIALGLGTGVWIMALDEPTNHLDLPAVERIEEALADYPGALLLVTHDETFGTPATRTTWRLEEGRLVVE